MPVHEVSKLTKILIAVRPWSFPASTMPVVFGAVAAATMAGAQFKPVLFILSLIGMVVLHAGSNVLGDVSDYKHGLDTEVTPVSGALVRGYLNSKQATVLGLGLMAVGCLIGLVLVYLTTVQILYIGIVGVIIGAFYSVPPLALKYHALGDFAVFMDFGILGALGSWTVQTGSVSAVPVVWAVPMAMLVAAILHGNNWRDMQTDSKGGFKTVAGLLGDSASLRYYEVLVFGPFAIVVALVLVGLVLSVQFALPWTSLIVLFALPVALKLWGRAKQRKSPVHPQDFILLDKSTAELNLMFGCLYTLSLLAAAWLA